MQKESQSYSIIRWVVVLLDLVLLNAYLSAFLLLFHWFSTGFRVWYYPSLYVILTLIYFACAYIKPPVLYLRGVRPEQIVGRNAYVMLMFSVLSFLFINYLHPGSLRLLPALVFYAGLAVLSISLRFIERGLLKHYRSLGYNRRDVIFVGSRSNMVELYNAMASDPTTGYNVVGYFDDEPGDIVLPYLGKIQDIPEYVARTKFHPAGRIYCGLPSKRKEDIKQIIEYCENHLIRFYSVPHIYSSIYRAMHIDFVGEVPVLYLREEPLRKPLNLLLKRCFDIVFSACVLCTVFLVALIFVAIGTLITDPGPIFFKQRRHGTNGKEFNCYKFRSMKVNSQADTLQATKDDPRKTKFGDLLRKTNIDELPQFWNVFIGDMSIVGPRPHMLVHTREYSDLISNYMVRHFVKPGITGYAQVTGCRGETKELKDMEERIKRDIWYIENWSFWLDIRIIWMTVANIFKGEEKAY